MTGPSRLSDQQSSQKDEGKKKEREMFSTHAVHAEESCSREPGVEPSMNGGAVVGGSGCRSGSDPALEEREMVLTYLLEDCLFANLDNIGLFVDTPALFETLDNPAHADDQRFRIWKRPVRV